jgi:predicted metal-binding membrane protein
VPLLKVFRRLTAHRAGRRVLLILVLLGYISAWALFGVGAHGFDAAFHQLASRSAWMVMHRWLVGAARMRQAGAHQFSHFKYRCLDMCRTPLMFAAEHWHGHDEHRDSFLLGVRHGAFCVGCRWALQG